MDKNKKIQSKLLLTFIFAALIANISGCLGVVMIKDLTTKCNSTLMTYGFVQGDIGNYNTYLNKCESLVRDVLLLTNASEIKQVQDELIETEKLTAQSLENIRRLCQSSEEFTLITKMDEFTPKYMDAWKRAVELGIQNKTDEALRVLHDEASPYLNECMSTGHQLMNYNANVINMISSQLTVSSNINTITIILVMIGAIIFSIVLACIVFRNIS